MLTLFPLASSGIEESTHKAGSLKKFDVFAKMLCSSFSKDNESVVVDILTPTDLEMIKARKTGSNSTSARSSASLSSFQKRYVILTYSSEFDRVHYPLALPFEDKPNVPALRRTIARLRRKIVERENQEREPSNDKERLVNSSFLYVCYRI